MKTNESFEISPQPIDPARIVEMARDSAHGGLNFFFGSVRGRNGGRAVRAVCYDAFEPLAETIFRELAAEARRRWGDGLRIVMVHRTGELAPGELSVAVGVSSPHRDESYQASRFLIEQIKHRAPIWKKEVYENGETEWLKGHALCQHAGSHAG